MGEVGGKEVLVDDEGVKVVEDIVCGCGPDCLV